MQVGTCQMVHKWDTLESHARHVQKKCTLMQRRLIPSRSCHERAPSVPCGVRVEPWSACKVGGAMGTMMTHTVECTSEGCCSYSTKSVPYCKPDLGIHPCTQSWYKPADTIRGVDLRGGYMCRSVWYTVECPSTNALTALLCYVLLRVEGKRSLTLLL